MIECTAPPQTPSLGQACTSTKHELNFVGASSIDFTIESSVNTAVELEIFSGSGPNKVLVSRFSAESYASARTPVRVMGASATVEYWTVVASTASPREGVGRGCSLLAEANIKHRPLHWVHAFARTVSWLCGQLAGALLNGTDDDESEELCRDWIQSGLFNGSFESYSQYVSEAPALESTYFVANLWLCTFRRRYEQKLCETPLCHCRLRASSQFLYRSFQLSTLFNLRHEFDG